MDWPETNPLSPNPTSRIYGWNTRGKHAYSDLTTICPITCQILHLQLHKKIKCSFINLTITFFPFCHFCPRLIMAASLRLHLQHCLDLTCVKNWSGPHIQSMLHLHTLSIFFGLNKISSLHNAGERSPGITIPPHQRFIGRRFGAPILHVGALQCRFLYHWIHTGTSIQWKLQMAALPSIQFYSWLVFTLS
jgi:hypothetical protein